MHNIPLAVLLQTIGSFFFAYAAFLQHDAVGTNVGDDTDGRMSSKALLKSIRSPRWIAGLACMLASLVLQVVSLSMAPVSVVQPVGLLAFPWSMIIQARAAKRGIPGPVRAAVGTTVAATVAFTILVAIFSAPETELRMGRVFAGALVIYMTAFGFGVLGTRGPRAWRSLFWASGGAVFYGLEAALVKSLIEFARTGDWLHSASFWILVAALLIGSATAGWMVQQGYATGAAEIVVASMTITSPVVAVLYGIGVLGEGRNLTFPAIVALLVLGVIALLGIIVLARLHGRIDADVIAPTPVPVPHHDADPAQATDAPIPPGVHGASAAAHAGDPDARVQDAPVVDPAAVEFGLTDSQPPQR